MRRFLISKELINSDGTIQIKGNDAGHIKNVLRMRPDDILCLTDGITTHYSCKIISIASNEIAVKIIRTSPLAINKPCKITIAQSYLKNKKMDTMVRQLTELGMDTWQPYLSKRSIVQLDDKKKAAQKKRWEKIAQESFKQCMRQQMPLIDDIIQFEQLINNNKPYDLKILLWEKEQLPLHETIKTIENTPNSVLIVLGPEGGFEDTEAATAIENGFICASLGPRILKADTAAISALALIQYLYGDIGTDTVNRSHF